MAWGLWLQKGLEALGKGGRDAVEGRVRWLQWTLSFMVHLLLPVGSGSRWPLVTVPRHSDGREPELQCCTRSFYLLLHITQVLSSPKAPGCFLQYK